IAEVTFNALGGHPPGPDYAHQRLASADIAWLRAALPGMRRRLAPLGLTILGGDAYLLRLAAGAAGERVPVADCHPGARFLYVDERGRAAPCYFTADELAVPISLLRSAGDLAELPAQFAAARGRQLLEACQDCHSTQVFGKFELIDDPLALRDRRG